MSSRFASEQLADLRHDAQLLIQGAADRESQLEALVAANVSMPMLDGVEATRLIKAGEATRHVRIIAYTGNPSFDNSQRRTLFAAVLTKPATPAAVLATVQQVAGL